MKKIRPVYVVLSILVLLLILFVIAKSRISKKSLPDYNENIQLTDIKQPVKVYRDSFAVPHIYASNEHDLYTAAGYLMAQDRLWQMDLMRRATTGNLAEIFGKSFISTDKLMRSLKITEKSQIVLEHSSQKVTTALKAFASGVNQYISNTQDQLPPEFTLLNYQPKKWKPIHSINLIGYMAWDLTMPWSYEITMHKLQSRLNQQHFQTLIPDVSSQKTPIYPNYQSDTLIKKMKDHLLTEKKKLENLGLKVFSGSNNWAVSGEKSTTGLPILANDMHLGLFTPGIWYQMHMNVPEKLHVTGVALPGQPFVISGHNDSIAWGMTNVMLDDMDFYKETIHKKDSGKYLLDGNWKDIKIEQEHIPVKDSDTITKIIKYTHRGPIISSSKGLDQSISMRWIGNEYSNELRSVYLLNHASNWKEFKNAVKTFISVSQNIVYADIQNNIGLYCCAGVPIREGNGLSVYPGDTTRYDWQGFIPFEQLPHSFNPESGIVSSANNKTVDETYPYYISHWFDLPSRIRRIRGLLKKKPQLSVEDFKRIQTDQHSEMVNRLKPQFLERLKTGNNSFSENEQLALKKLEAWDSRYEKTSTAALIFETLYIEFSRSLTKDEIGDTLFGEFLKRDILVRNLINRELKAKRTPWTDDKATPDKQESQADLMKASFHETIQKLEKKLGPDMEQWTWGKLHTLTLQHPLSEKKVLDKAFNLNRGPFSVGGSYHTVCPYSYPLNKPYKVNHGASHRQIYSLANWDHSWSVIPTGNSGIPASKHYCDQTELYIHKKYHKDVFSRKAANKYQKYHMEFIPKK